MKNFINKNIITPVLNLLKQGLTPEKIAASLAVGAMVSCFPILGTTTIICAIAAHFFKLNHVAIQIANYVGYPLWFIMLIPFMRLGNLIFGQEKMVFDWDAMMMHLQIDPQGFFQMYIGVALRACVAWAILAPIGGFILYFPLKFILQKLSRKS
jgi:uncharacterized protein (DUF2062 family)